MSQHLQFKLATEPAEFEGIHRLNYCSFVEEIPQHPPNTARLLVDRFHDENTYAVCLDGGEVVGMIAGRCQRPFSLDQKLSELDRLLPPHCKVVEVRLLAVVPRWRKQVVFARLAGVLASEFRARGCDLAVISGTLRQARLYRHLGFRPFGPQVGSPEARYQPMVLTLDDYADHVAHLEALDALAPVSLLPGPVAVADAVATALAQAPMSHRSGAFTALHGRVRERLLSLTGAAHAVLLSGSGTLANDAVAAQLSARGGRGLVLVNGEFGERLADHAARWRLDNEVLRVDWGLAFGAGAVARAFDRVAPAWVWAVACETSTGVRNDVDALRALCRRGRADLCLDAVSAVGLAPLDLSGVRLATTVSSKALGAYPGLAVVFHDGHLAPAGRLPRSIDLAGYVAAGGIPYTLPTNLVAALDAALDIDWPARWQAVAAAHALLEPALRAQGFAVVAPPAAAMAGILTLALPAACPAARLCQRMARRGYLLAHGSDYLRRRNWVQICLMGQWEARALEVLPRLLAAQAKAALQAD